MRSAHGFGQFHSSQMSLFDEQESIKEKEENKPVIFRRNRQLVACFSLFITSAVVFFPIDSGIS